MAKLIVVTLLVSLSLLATASRRSLIDAAIRDAKQAALQSSRTPPSDRAASALAAFKVAAPRLIEQGKARVLFEDMVKRAERKILQEVAQTSDTESRAEILARELLHAPGSVLTEEETAAIYEESGCLEFLTEPGLDCSDPAVRKYRTANGVCNNLENPLFGSAERKFRRIIPAYYEDGVAQLRGTMQSMILSVSVLPHDPFRPPYPSARLVSEGVVRDRVVEETRFSHIIMQWGQFLDHDLAHTPSFTCSERTCTIETDTCVPIRIPSDDPVFGTRFGDPTAGPVCHPFARSFPACDSSPPGQLGPREQITDITSWIDGSMVYGSSQALQDRLRDGTTAFLRTGDPIPSDGGDSLPPVDQSDIDNGFIGCSAPQPSDCFLAGDVRVMENTGLTIMHTLFVREHNRIAEQLQQLDSEMDDETVFKLTREIVAAEIQKITYHDYLPRILGQCFFDENIKPYEGYDSRVDPTVPNAFAAAAYRFGHSQIQPVFDRLDVNFQNITVGPLSLLDAFANPAQYTISEGTDPLLRGLFSKPARATDEFLNSILTTELFGTLDLATLNIQRGRDHGIPPYLVWKNWATRTCGETSDFRNKLTYIRLLQTYGSLDTVDLWVGGLAEKPVHGGLVGATLTCIFANTFGPLRNADRFYFENVKSDSNPDAFFTARQRDEIKKASLSRIICDNSDNIGEIQPDAFCLDQGRVPCSNPLISSMDLSVFVPLCAMRIRVTNSIAQGSITFQGESRPLSGMQTTTTKVTVNTGESTACVPFICPEPGQQVELRISTPNDMCREQDQRRNSALPANAVSSPLHAYKANIGTQHIGMTTGAYESVTACEVGSENGLFYICPSGAKQNEMHKEQNVDKNEKLITLLEEYVQELKEEEMPKQPVEEDDEAYLLSELEDALNG